MSENPDIGYLLSPLAIRERARALYELALEGRTQFRVREERLPEVADFVTEVTLARYPDLRIPFHSRWGHFQAGGRDRLAELERRLASHRARADAQARARAKFDLVIVSVLLDAGAGAEWSYLEAAGAEPLGRSEGLAVASLNMFMDGAFSADPSDPFRADATRLASLREDELARGFQVSATNPLLGLEGRLGLLRRLGERVLSDAERFPAGARESARPGNLVDYCRGRVTTAPELLLAVLRGLGPIWPGRVSIAGVNLGDVWSHPLLGARDSAASLVPFHKLSQWLTYSLIEPLEEAGTSIADVGALTGLAEYRNGGLLLDRGLIELRDPAAASLAHRHDSELVIEWRALTITLLDRLAREVRARLGKTEEELPLARILEGGTWHAGRKAAKLKRADGGPPLRIASDGTVF